MNARSASEISPPRVEPVIDVEVRPGLRLDSGPAVFLENCGALVVADLHWGYAASQREAGRLVPRWGDEIVDARLRALLEFHRPRALVLVGDIVHRGTCGEAAVAALAGLAGRTRLVVVAGNHDRRWKFPTVATHAEDGWFFHHGHEAHAVPPGCVEVVGHHHPAVSWSDGAGTRVKTPALVEGPRRLILPAFSPWAAGTPWNHRLEAGERLWLISARRIFPFPATPAPAR